MIKNKHENKVILEMKNVFTHHILNQNVTLHIINVTHQTENAQKKK